jgi:hypothetical protein
LVLSGTGPLPASFDWRDVDGVDWTTSIKSQGSCGSCVAFGTLGALEAVVQIEHGVSYDVDLSESFLFYCGGGTCVGGWYPSEASDYLVNVGVTDEACFPYLDWDLRCNEKASNWNQRLIRVSRSGTVVNEVSIIKEALLEYGPLSTTMKVFEDFRYYSSGVYDHVWGRELGGHCVTIVGYNDDPGYWICKNSWGTGWGEQGWFNIKYRRSELGKHTYFYTDVYGNLPPNEPINPSPSDGAVNVESETMLEWEYEEVDDDSMKYSVYLAEGSKVVLKDLLIEDVSDVSFDLSELKNNMLYSWMVIAEDEHGSQRWSDVWRFHTVENISPVIDIVDPREGVLYWNDHQMPFFGQAAVLIGDVTLEVNASDDGSGLERVDVFLNNEFVQSLSDGDFSFSLSEKSFGFPVYVLKVVAFDRAGNTASKEVLIRIINL